MADPITTTSNVTAAEIAALGALIGAFVGSVTGFVTKQISDSLEKQDKRRELIRSKLEEFTYALATAYTWSRALEKCCYLEELKALGECSESHRIIALAALYFDEMSKDAEAYADGLDNYFSHAVGKLNDRPPRPTDALLLRNMTPAVSWLQEYSSTGLEGLDRSLSEPYIKLRRAVTRRVKDWQEGKPLSWWAKSWQEAGD